MARIRRANPDAKPKQYHPWTTEYSEKSIPGVRPGAINRKRTVTKNVIPELVEERREMVSERPRAMYDPEKFPYIAEVLCRNYGMNNKALGVVFGVTEKTIEAWCYKNKDFHAAIRAGKNDFDSARIETALVKRAMGYKYVEKSVKTVRIKAKHKYEDYEVYIPAVETIITQKELAPDVKAIMFWLTNRSQERWKMVTTVNANIKAKQEVTKRNVNINADISNMTSDQLRALRDIVRSRQSSGGEVIEVNGPTAAEDIAANMIDYVQGLGASVYQQEMLDEPEEMIEGEA